MWKLRVVYEKIRERIHSEPDRGEREERKYYKIRKSTFWFLIWILCLSVVGVRHEMKDSENETEEWVSVEKKAPKSKKSGLKNTEECYLCGNNSRSLMGLYRNYEDLGIICVNEWYVLDMRIRNHDNSGNLMGPQGFRNVTYTSIEENSCFFHCNPDSDRGISTVTVSYGNDSILDAKRVRNYLCQNCLDKVWEVMEVYVPEDEEARPKDLCLVDFQTMELYSLQGNYSAYYVRDYYVQVDSSREDELEVTAFYAPVLENGYKVGE